MKSVTSSLQALGIERLSVEERIALVADIWDSIAEATPLTEAQRRELDRRLQEHETDPGDVVTWDVVKASIAARLKR
jgi:putative addiction module component (TIGR02574 family)